MIHPLNCLRPLMNIDSYLLKSYHSVLRLQQDPRQSKCYFYKSFLNSKKLCNKSMGKLQMLLKEEIVLLIKRQLKAGALKAELSLLRMCIVEKKRRILELMESKCRTIKQANLYNIRTKYHFTITSLCFNQELWQEI